MVRVLVSPESVIVKANPRGLRSENYNLEDHIEQQNLSSSLCFRTQGFASRASGKEFTCQCRRYKRHRLYTYVGKIPLEKAKDTG